MLHAKNINFNHRLGVLMLLGFLVSAGIGMAKSVPTYALICDENSMVSCIDITFGDIVGGIDLKAPSPTSSSHGIDRAYFYLPVSLTIAHANDFSIKVYSQNGGELRSPAGDVIPTLAGEAAKGTSLQDLGKDGSVWGYRFNLGDVASDPTKNYLKVPGVNDPEANIISREQITAPSGTTSKILTLGFAAAVDGNLPAGSYSDQIVIAVIASPKQTSAFGLISTMQEMTSEICANVTTPRADAELTDSTGIHHGDNRYVPESTLTDIRDGKTYLVRKLADGNCWMSQNLEFDFVPTTSKDISAGSTPANAFSSTGDDTIIDTQITLTNVDTDLNSIDVWTPAIAAEQYGEAGTVFRTQKNAGKGNGTNDTAVATTATKWYTDDNGSNGDGSDGVRSFSNAAAYPNALVFGTTTEGDPWQRFGNLYNWTAATLGSGTKTTDDDQNATDSICPRGWKLPYNVGGDSFANLLGAYGLSASNATTASQSASFPLNFLRTGIYTYSTGLLYGRATSGNWWSATRKSATSANRLNANNGGVNPQHSDYRGHGFAIRCVAR